MSSRPASQAQVVVITGLSGAGRSEAAKSLEDLGWFVIDNLPPQLIPTMFSLAFAPGNDIRRLALVIDVRGGGFFKEASAALDKVREEVGSLTVVFLEADDDALVRRFDATRRRHPMSSGDRVVDGIKRERELTQRLRDMADIVINTSDISVHQLRAKIGNYFQRVSAQDELTITVMSFGYKHGLPLDADMVLDCRFLPNPHWVEGLRELTGKDQPVKDYVLSQEPTSDFLERTRDLLAVTLPGYQTEGRHYLTVAVGCTGGRHRSVVLVQEVARAIEEKGFTVNVVHRDVERAGQDR